MVLSEGIRGTHLISAFHGSDKDARICSVDAKGLVEEGGKVFGRLCIAAIHDCGCILAVQMTLERCCLLVMPDGRWLST